jgi:hypothetical protein
LKSTRSSERFFTFEETTALFLNCFVPTLFGARAIAA